MHLLGTLVAAQDVTEEEEAADEDATDDVIAEDEDDEAEVEDDENTELVRALCFLHCSLGYYMALINLIVIVIDLGQTEEKEEEEDEEALGGEMKPSPNADTTILFVKGEGSSPLNLPLLTL